MQQHNLFRNYLDKVCEQIRWKKSHHIVCRELGNHLEDEQAILLESGLTEDEAANKAVLDMGDASLVGSQLDRVYRPRPAWGIIAVTAILLVLGCIVRLYVVRYVPYSPYPANIPRSLCWLGAAVIVMITGYFLDFSIIGRHPFIAGAGFATILIIISQMFAVSFNTAFYYVNGLMALLPVIYVGILWWWPYRGYGGLIGAYLLLGGLVFISLMPVGAFWAALLYGGISGLMLTAELIRGRFGVQNIPGLLILFSPAALAAGWLWNNTSIGERISVILHPELEPLGSGFAGMQIRKILDNASWIGTGGYTAEHLPAAGDYYMLTFLIHQIGWIALVTVFLLFIALFVFSIVLIFKQKNRLGRMVSFTILLILTMKSSIYIVSNMGITVAGFVGLPLISYGNAALLTDSFLIGLMLSVFRNSDVVRDPIIAPKTIPRIRITMERLP